MLAQVQDRVEIRTEDVSCIPEHLVTNTLKDILVAFCISTFLCAVTRSTKVNKPNILVCPIYFKDMSVVNVPEILKYSLLLALDS